MQERLIACLLYNYGTDRDNYDIVSSGKNSSATKEHLAYLK